MHHVAIFTSNTSWDVPATLIRGTLAALASCDDMSLKAICVPKFQHYATTLSLHMTDCTLRWIQSKFNPELPGRPFFPLPIHLNRLALRFGFDIKIPPRGDFNDAAFISGLRRNQGPLSALSFFCLQKFSVGFLEAFNQAVNYHNGLLPDYRGRRATAWSVYNGEKKTGYTFHHMTREFDEGAILLEGAIPVHSSRSPYDLDKRKALAAANQMPRLLTMIQGGNTGKVQREGGVYYSMKKYQTMTRINDPSSLTRQELLLRLRSFEKLSLSIDGEWYAVSKLQNMPDNAQGTTRFCFRTADGHIMKAVLFKHLPYRLYVAKEQLKSWIQGRLPG